jgi:phage baseplate assembly protein W
MALQRITPGLSKETKVTPKKKFYSDIDLSFAPKTGSPDIYGNYSGDIYKKLDANAVLQAVETILLTNTLEKPFEPSFGADLRSILFESDTDYSEAFITEQIRIQIARWEPRATVVKIQYLSGGELINSGISSLRNVLDNTIEIVIDLEINNKGFTSSINLNRFR